MIARWSTGPADAHMPEEVLAQLAGPVARHPWWRARAALVLDLLRRENAGPPSRVLDVGTGWGTTFLALEGAGHRAVGLDVSPRALAALDRPGRELIEADLMAGAPSDWEGADAVLALDVLEHIDDDRGAAKRLAELARPGGLVVVSVPAGPGLFSEFDAIQGHRRRYDPPSLMAALEGSGLVGVRWFWWGAWSLPLLERQRRRPKARPGDSPARAYARYLELPSWPVPALMALAYDWERPRALDGKLKRGSSLFALGRRPGPPQGGVPQRGPGPSALVFGDGLVFGPPTSG